MWELDHKAWAPKNWCFPSIVLMKTLDGKIKPVNPKGNQHLKFIRRIDAEAEAPLVGHLIWRANSLVKTPDAWKDWRQEKWMTQDEMVGWHHWLDGHEFEKPPGVGEGQGGLACCDSWGCKESDTNERLNWTELNWGGKYQNRGLWKNSKETFVVKGWE